MTPRMEHAALTSNMHQHHTTCNAQHAAWARMPNRRISRGRPAAQPARNQSFATVRYRIRDADSGTLRAFDRGFCANNCFFVKTHGDSEQVTQMYRWDRPHEGGADDFTFATKREVLAASPERRVRHGVRHRVLHMVLHRVPCRALGGTEARCRRS